MADSRQKKLIVASKTGKHTPAKRRKVSGCVRGGILILHETAGKTVGESSTQITAKLLELALWGNVNCAKLLVALAELQQEPEDEKKGRRSWSAALALGAETQWQEPAEEATAGMNGGSLEPEG
jgi:hypothetical protein